MKYLEFKWNVKLFYRNSIKNIPFYDLFMLNQLFIEKDLKIVSIRHFQLTYLSWIEKIIISWQWTAQSCFRSENVQSHPGQETGLSLLPARAGQRLQLLLHHLEAVGERRGRQVIFVVVIRKNILHSVARIQMMQFIEHLEISTNEEI